MVNSSKVYTVLLVEDDGPTRERLAKAVNKHDQLQVPWQFATLKEGLNQLENTPPDVVLTDLGLPDGHGIDLIRRARQLSETMEIMVISVFGDERNVVSAIEAGATGYLLKDGPADYIGESIIDMLNGSSPISASIARHILKCFRHDAPHLPEGKETKQPEKTPPADIPKLTKRETDVLEYITRGFTFNEVAGILNLSPHTVTSHIKHIYRKLEVKSRSEAVFEAVQLGLVDIRTDK
ncbi:MAG TPA: DNA-binding response regulator [Gammaproteobacteria bacterium]|nr:DNA-binding response regulator [Gammaproteobacteria bacterium]